MKRLIIILLTIFSTLTICATNKAGITFVATTYDFGNIKENGGNVSCYFEFENSGSQPLIVISAKTSCGCTQPEYPKKPIKKGERAKIKVTYLPKGRPGAFDKTIMIKTNAGTKYLRIKGYVIP